MTKTFFSKRQAISALNCIESRQEIDVFAPIKDNDKRLKMSCEELEQQLLGYLESGGFAGVVEEPITL